MIIPRLRFRAGTLLVCSLVMVAAAACKKRVTQTVPAPGATGRLLDTARGVVRRVGNDPLSVLVLTSGAGQNASVLALAGQAAPLAALDRAIGLEVSVAGVLTTERNVAASPRGAFVFQVRHFFVRAADGQPAVDGVLNMQNGNYSLVSANGVRHEVPNLPNALRSQVGARVFLVGPLDRAPSAYGILADK